MDKARFIGGISLRRALELARNVADLIAKPTENTIDDSLVELIDAILASDELMAWFEGLFETGSGPAVLPAAMPQAAASPNMASIWLPLLIELVKTFLDR